jgi:hypothetical protein
MEIPVQKKSSVPWWLWLIAGLLLLGLIWWLVASLGGDSDDVQAAAAPEAPPAVAAAPYAEEPAQAAAAPTPAGPQEPITDLTTVFEAADRRALIGREFQLSDVDVLDVVGDRTFWVGEGDRHVFAALREVPPPGWPTDADININSRQTVSIRGTVADASSGDLNGRALQNMPPGTDIVLFAQTAEVLTRP